MSNKIILYTLEISPPGRAIATVAKLIGLELEIRNVDFLGGEHLSESYVKMNPEHTLPMLDDNGFIIWESHAICAYLIDKYAEDDKLYPKDLQLRAKCNQRMFFDAASLFVRLRDIGMPIYFKGCTEIPQEKINAIIRALEILETFLEIDPFLVGTNLTIADICLGLTIPIIGTYTPVTAEKFPKILAWLERISQTIPFFDEMHAKYPQLYRKMLRDVIEKNKRNK